MIHRAVILLLKQALSSLWRGGELYRAYFGYLLLQAIVLVLWWPKSDLASALERGVGSDVLSAVVVVAAGSIAYTSLRAGAEELMADGQHSLHEWRQVAALPTGWLVAGYLAGHALTTAHLMALSAPIVLTAWGVGGGNWPGLLLCCAGVMLLALNYRMLGALLYLRFGHAGSLMFVALRGVFAVVFVVLAFMFPPSSFLVLTLDCFASAAPRAGAAVQFFVVYTLAAAILTGLLCRAINGLRSRAALS
ncbi:MAG: hypothetical protein GKR94_11025 [Gammaproteobacteria bacterium]|nr:hypothetical protein [Gammaproteobacteria bacterium]